MAAVSVVTAAQALFVTTALGQHQLTIEDLTTIARSNQQAIEVIEVTYRVTQEAVEGVPFAGYLEEAESTIIAETNGDRFWMRTRTRPRGSKTFGSTLYNAYDGKTGYAYIPDARSATIGTSPPAENAPGKNEILKAGMLYPPTSNGMGFDDLSLVSLLKNGRLRDETEAIREHECHVVDIIVEGTREATVWLDARRGASIVRAVSYNRTDPKEYVGTVNVMQLVLLEDQTGRQAWVPAVVESESRIGNLRSAQRTTLDVENARLNPRVDRNAFRISLPRGTTVVDIGDHGDASVIYTTESASAPEGILDDSVRAVMESFPVAGVEGTDRKTDRKRAVALPERAIANKPSDPGNRLVLGVALLAVAGAMLIYVAKRMYMMARRNA